MGSAEHTHPLHYLGKQPAANSWLASSGKQGACVSSLWGGRVDSSRLGYNHDWLPITKRQGGWLMPALASSGEAGGRTVSILFRKSQEKHKEPVQRDCLSKVKERQLSDCLWLCVAELPLAHSGGRCWFFKIISEGD